MYHKRTGKKLSFVPMYLAPKLKKIFFCKPIVYDPDIPMDIQRGQIKQQLMDDGMRVMVVKLTNPYTQRSIQPDYKKMMNIIALWNLTDYKRVIFVDSYTIFHENFDSLFNCSYLCLKDEQPLVSPVSSVFRRSIRMT